MSRHILKPTGSTYVTEDSPFVTSDDVDFHPTDVIEDADGSLLVVDTGGWYKLCCPSSQLVKADVLGGIYRVKKTGSHKSKFKPPAEALTKLYWASLNRDPNGFDLAVAGLQFSDYQTRRLAAEALGRIGDKRAVPVILKALEDEKIDHVLRHSLTYALIEIGDVAGTREGLNNPNESVKRQTIAALNSIPNGLKPDDLNSTIVADSPAKQTAWWVMANRPEFADTMIPFIKNKFGQPFKSININDAAKEHEYLIANVAKLSRNKNIQTMIAEIITNPEASTESITSATFVIREAGLKITPELWFDAIALLLSTKKGEAISGVVLFCTSKLNPGPKGYPTGYINALATFIDRPSLKPEIRLLALASVPTQQTGLSDQNFNLSLSVLKYKDGHNPLLDRGLQALERAKLVEYQFLSLAPYVSSLSSNERSRLLALFDRTRSEPVGLALVKALNTPEMRAKIRVEQVKPILDKYPAAVKAEAEKLYAELEKSRAGEIAKFEALVKDLPAGDVRRGQVVFHSQKANCKACHTIGYVGGKVGPDLTRIGGIRTERDLLESIVFPSASFVRSYEPVRVNTKDGRTLNGNIKHDRPDEIVLTVAADQEVRIARENVEEVVPGQVSVMPSGLDQQMTKQELADLVAFLKANK